MVKIWDMESYKIVATLRGHTEPILSVDFSPDGKTLATCSADNTIKFWDTISWKESLPSLGQKEYVTSLAFSPDGKILATVSNDRIMKLWNAATRHELASFKLSADAMHIVFSPDGQTMAVRSWNGSLRLWRAPVPGPNASEPERWHDRRRAPAVSSPSARFDRAPVTLHALSCSDQ
jgi:WD40 repeat protein